MYLYGKISFDLVSTSKLIMLNQSLLCKLKSGFKLETIVLNKPKIDGHSWKSRLYF